MAQRSSVVPVLGGEPVAAITSHLSTPGRVAGKPLRLAKNSRKAFIGSYILGIGFTMSPMDARHLIDNDPKNAEVLFQYLSGDDLNSSPTQTASRWVINFFDWSEEQTREYPDCFKIVERRVRPERSEDKRTARRDRWWRYAEPAPNLYKALRPLESCVALTLHTKHLQPTVVSPEQDFSHGLAVLPWPIRLILASFRAHFIGIGPSNTALRLRAGFATPRPMSSRRFHSRKPADGRNCGGEAGSDPVNSDERTECRSDEHVQPGTRSRL